MLSFTFCILLCDFCICKTMLLEGFHLCLCIATNHDQTISTNPEFPYLSPATDMLFQHLQSVPISHPKYVWKCIFQTWLYSRSKVNNIRKEIPYSEFSVLNYCQLLATSYMCVPFQLTAARGPCTLQCCFLWYCSSFLRYIQSVFHTD